MNINEFLKKKEYTIYRLSKDSCISKTTLYDICSGKSNILDCTIRIILKIANTLNCDINDLINLEPVLYKPAYEQNLPIFLQESIDNIKRKNKKNPFYDCYIEELRSNINVCKVEDLISKDHADYLRKKYL